MNKILVLCESLLEFKILKNDKKKYEFIHIINIEQILGYKKDQIKFIKIGNWYLKEKNHEILMNLKERYEEIKIEDLK